MAEALPWHTRRGTRVWLQYEIKEEVEVTTLVLTPSLNLNYPKLRLLLNSSNGLAGNAFVKPSAT